MPAGTKFSLGERVSGAANARVREHSVTFAEPSANYGDSGYSVSRSVHSSPSLMARRRSVEIDARPHISLTNTNPTAIDTKPERPKHGSPPPSKAQPEQKTPEASPAADTLRPTTPPAHNRHEVPGTTGRTIPSRKYQRFTWVVPASTPAAVSKRRPTQNAQSKSTQSVQPLLGVSLAPSTTLRALIPLIQTIGAKDLLVLSQMIQTGQLGRVATIQEAVGGTYSPSGPQHRSVGGTYSPSGPQHRSPKVRTQRRTDKNPKNNERDENMNTDSDSNNSNHDKHHHDDDHDVRTGNGQGRQDSDNHTPAALSRPQAHSHAHSRASRTHSRTNSADTSVIAWNMNKSKRASGNDKVWSGGHSREGSADQRAGTVGSRKPKSRSLSVTSGFLLAEAVAIAQEGEEHKQLRRALRTARNTEEVLRNIMADKLGMASLKAFAESEHNSENLNFCEEVSKFKAYVSGLTERRMTQTERRMELLRRVAAMYEIYVKQDDQPDLGGNALFDIDDDEDQVLRRADRQTNRKPSPVGRGKMSWGVRLSMGSVVGALKNKLRSSDKDWDRDGTKDPSPRTNRGSQTSEDALSDDASAGGLHRKPSFFTRNAGSAATQQELDRKASTSPLSLTHQEQSPQNSPTDAAFSGGHQEINVDHACRMGVECHLDLLRRELDEGESSAWNSVYAIFDLPVAQVMALIRRDMFRRYMDSDEYHGYEILLAARHAQRRGKWDELFESEDKYVVQLCVLQEAFQTLLKMMQELAPGDQNIIYGESVQSAIGSLIVLHTSIRYEMGEIQKKWTEQTEVGPLFLDNVDKMKPLYRAYGNGYAQSFKFLQHLMLSDMRRVWEKSPDLKRAFVRIEPASVDSLMTEPMTRAKSYVSFLSTLLEVTCARSADYKPIQEARTQLHELQLTMDHGLEEAKFWEEIKKMAKPELFDARCRFIRWGTLLKQSHSKQEEKEFFLFSNWLVYAIRETSGSSTSYAKVNLLPINDRFRVRTSCSDRCRATQDQRFEFCGICGQKVGLLIENSQKHLTIFCKSFQDRVPWLRDLHTAILCQSFVRVIMPGSSRHGEGHGSTKLQGGRFTLREFKQTVVVKMQKKDRRELGSARYHLQKAGQDSDEVLDESMLLATVFEAELGTRQSLVLRLVEDT